MDHRKDDHQEYENSWEPTNDPSGLLHIRAIFSKWCPPNEKWDPNYLPCWQDGPLAPPYPYGTYQDSGATGRKCPWEKGSLGPWKDHFAPETSNLFKDYFSDDGSHWCYDGNVTRTELGVLEYLNEEMSDSDIEKLPIFHIVVNTHDWGPRTISLDLAFPSISYYPPNLQVQPQRFEDDTLFVGEYRKGKRRGWTHADPNVCENCWESDSLSMRVYSTTSSPNKHGNITRDSNGRRKVGQPISKDDIATLLPNPSAKKKGFEFIDYEFSVKYAGGGGKLRIAIPIMIMDEIIGAKWNSSPLRIFPPLG